MLPTTAPTLFVHFKNAATGALLFAMITRTNDAGVTEEVRAKDESGKDKPIGVTVYTPGSKVYRTAMNMNATANMKGGKKELSGEKLDQQQTDLLARTTIKVHNFECATGFDALRAWYDDEANVAYREQVADEQGDLGKSLILPAKS